MENKTFIVTVLWTDNCVSEFKNAFVCDVNEAAGTLFIDYSDDGVETTKHIKLEQLSSWTITHK